MSDCKLHEGRHLCCVVSFCPTYLEQYLAYKNRHSINIYWIQSHTKKQKKNKKLRTATYLKGRANMTLTLAALNTYGATPQHTPRFLSPHMERQGGRTPQQLQSRASPTSQWPDQTPNLSLHGAPSPHMAVPGASCPEPAGLAPALLLLPLPRMPSPCVPHLPSINCSTLQLQRRALHEAHLGLPPAAPAPPH